MDYNTSRKQLVLPEYGRNIQNMVDYIMEIEDRDERNRLAKAVINIMGNMNPHLRDINDFKHKLWDHLAIMSEFKLDIDYPYEIPVPATFTEKPRIVPYQDSHPMFKHYGRSIELLIEEAIKMEDETMKNILIALIANHMKKSYLTWNKDAVSDEQIKKDLERLSKGKLIIPDDFSLSESKDLMNKNRKKKTTRSKNIK